MSKKTIRPSSLTFDRDVNIEKSMPTEFVEQYTVKKPIGIRVHKQDCRITHVLPESSLHGLAFIGDTVVAVDGKNTSNGEELNRKLRENTEKVQLHIRHNNWSWCLHVRTTVEKIQIDRDVERISSNPVNHYFILIRVKPSPEITPMDLGIHVQYNNRDRLEVASVTPGSLGSVHLRSGDTIRECNGQSICSKTMLRYLIASGIAKSGYFTLYIESPINDAARDHIEVADDVVKIAEKEVEELKKKMKQKPKGSGTSTRQTLPPKNAKKSGNVAISKAERAEFHIVSDIDPTKLKPCKNAS